MKANLHTNESYFCMRYSPTSSFVLLSEPQGCIRQEELLLDRNLVSNSHWEDTATFLMKHTGLYWCILLNGGKKRFVIVVTWRRGKILFQSRSLKVLFQKTKEKMKKGIIPLGFPQNFRGHNAQQLLVRDDFYIKMSLNPKLFENV